METREGAAAAAPLDGFAEETSAEARRLVGEEGQEKLDPVPLLRLKEQINQQLLEYNTTINANDEIITDQVTDEKAIVCAIEDLGKELEELKLSHKHKTLALQRLQVNDALRAKLRNNDDNSKLIWETIEHIMMLSTAVIKSKQQSRELEEKLNEVKRRKQPLRQAIDCKLADIHNMKMKQKEELENMEVSEMLKKARGKLQKEIEMTTLIQNIFQLITGSQVNWLEDPALKEIVLQLEKNVTRM
ncbi:centromere protein H isoform X2 [Zootoca vivipara]|uniref:centromere protein H isoform X2 n=1 Tax=Zootoca vivipara TaxID=8524 RepID=UPI001590E2AE|nr:centromere protein H isoform X2 [Zootoca vivipara]